MTALLGWTTNNTVMVIIAVVILIVLIVLMSTRKPGPEHPVQLTGSDEGPEEPAAEVEGPDAEEHKP